ncbi:MAG: hypothetical protein ACRDDY_19015 [Clostridium sp.]|uniref:hypothetical protein n=1 Tax=Clostridium sp. TaxID=1506 RepID=UPI003EE514B9
MAKPSIFSKDYEKKMKQRRLKVVLVIVVLLAVSLGLFYQFKLKDMDFNQIINSLQAWVNNETVPAEKQTEADKKTPVKEDKPVNNISKQQIKEFKLLNNENIKVKITDTNGNLIFNGIEDKGYYSSISPNKKEMVILDKNQNMFLINVSGSVKNITKEEYVSSKGSKFPKETMMKKEKDSGVNYIWGVNPVFIDDSNIAYVSNLPYFGASAKNKYIWVYNIENNTYKAIYKSASPETEIIGNSNGKGTVKVKIGNNEYNLDNKGNLSKE